MSKRPALTPSTENPNHLSKISPFNRLPGIRHIMVVNVTENSEAKMASHCGFHFISSNVRENQCFSIYFLAIYISSFVKCRLKLFTHISMEILTFSYLFLKASRMHINSLLNVMWTSQQHNKLSDYSCHILAEQILISFINIKLTSSISMWDS